MKKGSTVQYINWIMSIGLAIIISIFIFLIASTYLGQPVQTTEFEATLLTNSLTYNCLRFDDTARLGTIDLGKLNDDHLKNCYAKPNIGYKVTFLDEKRQEIKSAKYFPSLNQEKIIPVCDTLPEFKCSSREVFTLTNSELTTKGFLNIEVISHVG